MADNMPAADEMTMGILLQPYIALLLSGMLAMVFVLSLYIWKNDKDRDHRETIQKRFISMGICCMLAPLPVIGFIHYYDQQPKYLVWLGLSPVGLPNALIWPLMLTGTLFLGPLVDENILSRRPGTIGTSRITSTTMKEFCCCFFHPLDDFTLKVWRNYVVAPLAEELVFRACICSLLVHGGWSHTVAGIVAPLMFGFAHLHHLVEHMRHANHGFAKALTMAGFQMCYTTVFGIYASFLFFRTGHLLAPFISHAFCNKMGLPDFQSLFTSKYRKALTIVYITGIIGFISLLMPLTTPEWYNPYIWYYQAPPPPPGGAGGAQT
uniref:intramembrane prenyl-peptidase Rce1 n=1 Tax=Lotharella oceanica TaxID=641309 RepID=A0A7S2TKX4_9EUKA|mmetsp:Transcript_1902/g.3594  ORF Transcript_1902/g.3594 Transcript_1902/m.3594 type:complete len:322 (+) Transcript_1902:135-1100(+)